MRLDLEVGRLASSLDADVTRPGSWFDGFWDFFVQNRTRIHDEPAWEIQGAWGAILLLAPQNALEAHVFVECKDRRPGVRAPWPVSSFVIGDGPVTLGAHDAHDRPHDDALAAQLGHHAFVADVGYYGVHASRVVEHTSDEVDRLILILPEVVRIAVALAADLRACER